MKKGAVFRQSASDFPLTVKLGEKMPTWELSRWGGNEGLRFVPPDDEGFTLRGDKQRLLYKGRRRSHRFNILGDSAFEYDCIFEREPESNAISLRMDGAENFHFYRQPDFVKEPFLKGSYAVYKKETLVGEGTGKLCHIQRPEIIDARGRRCWGDLSVAGNELRITIPEKWLGEAKYPVVVDPTVGTATVGSQTENTFYSDRCILYKYPVSEKISGRCTAYIYCCSLYSSGLAYPSLHTDNNGCPHLQRSKKENYISVSMNYGAPGEWRNNTFEVDGTLAKNSYVWFGVRIRSFTTAFDYTDGETVMVYCPNGGLPPTEIGPEHILTRKNIRYSWYFTYESGPSGDDFFYILTGNVGLTDNRRLTAGYERKKTESVNAADESKTAYNFIRFLAEIAGVNSLPGRFAAFYRCIKEAVKGADKAVSQVVIARTLHEALKPKDMNSRFGMYYRCLFDTIQTDSEARAGRIQFAKIADTVQAAGAVFRELVMRVCIVTGVFVRDYLLGRFLKARSELELKSVITREITIDSKIH